MNYPHSSLRRAIRGLSLLPFVLGLYTSGLHAQSAPPAASSEQIEAAKRDAEVLGRQMQHMPTLDAQGSVVLNADGSVKREPTSSQQSEAQNSLMKSITGLSGYEALGNPAGKGARAGAAAAVTGHVDFACGLSSGTTQSVAGYVFKFTGCRLQDGKVHQIGLQLCTKLSNGGLCSPADYSAPSLHDVDAYSSIDEVEIGVGCNQTIRSCRITVTGKFSIVGTGATITQQAEDRQGGQDFRQAMTAVSESSTYQGYQQSATALGDCYAQNQKSFRETGVVSTCDGLQQAALASGPSGPACSPTRTCLKEVVTSSSYNTSCTRGFNLTTNKCQMQVPSRECTTIQDRFTNTTTSSCTAEDIAGGVLISSAEDCAQFIGDELGGSSCVRNRRVESYVFPDQRQQIGECVASPAPLAGPFGPTTCAMGEADQELTCEADGWFGRTLSEQECFQSGVDSEGTPTAGPIDYRTKAGCGYCVRPTIGYTCRAAANPTEPADSCSTMDLAGCTLVSADTEGTFAGLATSQKESYRCTKSTTQCTDWKVTNTCVNIDGDYGVSEMPVRETADQTAMTQVISAAGIVNSLSEDAGGASVADPRIFAGKDMRCEKPVGFLSDAFANDCCRINLTRTGGSSPSNACKDSEVKLAASRRARHEVYIGEYCSKRTGLLNRCVKRTQTYCVFSGVLPRIVQTQGRQQLNAVAGSSFGASLQTERMEFPYYAAQGGWQSPILVNGQSVAVFQQPTYCRDVAEAARELTRNPGARECPNGIGLWFATCDKGAQCGELPVAPEAGSRTWQLTFVDPLNTTMTALSRYALAHGACDTGSEQCRFDIAAWPAGVGGQSVISRDLQFEISARLASNEQSVILGDALIQVAPAPGMLEPGTLPDAVAAKVSLDGGSSWTDFVLPTRIKDTLNVPGTDVTASGGCQATTGLCEYRFIGTVSIAAKPWGSAKAPDCSGFSLSQLSALDFSTMDLSEWIASVQARPVSTDELAAQAQRRADEGTNRTTATPPAEGLTARVTPQRDLGPFVVQLAVTGNWPETYEDATRNNDPVHGVDIDWGDCSNPTRAMAVPGGGYAAEHTYGSPSPAKTPGICDRQGPVVGNGRELTHVIQLTIHSTSGSHQKTLEVRNVFQQY